MTAATGATASCRGPPRRAERSPTWPGTICHPIPAHRKQMAHCVTYQGSMTATCRPGDPRLMTECDHLPCTPEVPGIYLPWTCAATGRATASTPTHPILHDVSESASSRVRPRHGPPDAVVRDVQRQRLPGHQVLRAAAETGHNRPLSGWMTGPDILALRTRRPGRRRRPRAGLESRR
jgi:hypothetical protein